MVGYRNDKGQKIGGSNDFIRHSDGGVSEQLKELLQKVERLYQAFRWWGIGTLNQAKSIAWVTLSGIPMVGYRNT